MPRGGRRELETSLWSLACWWNQRVVWADFAGTYTVDPAAQQPAAMASPAPAAMQGGSPHTSRLSAQTAAGAALGRLRMPEPWLERSHDLLHWFLPSPAWANWNCQRRDHLRLRIRSHVQQWGGEGHQWGGEGHHLEACLWRLSRDQWWLPMKYRHHVHDQRWWCLQLLWCLEMGLWPTY